MFWVLLVGFAVLYAVQTVLSLWQARDMSNTYVELRRRGRVVIGKKKGLFVSGAIVMFQLDDEGTIVEGRKMSGVTAFARFRPFACCNGKAVASVSSADVIGYPKSVRSAVDNASENYRLIAGGAEAPEPPGPFAGLAAGARRMRRRRPNGGQEVAECSDELASK